MSNISDRAATYFGFANDPETARIKTGRRSVLLVLRRKDQAVLGFYKESAEGRIDAEFVWLAQDMREALAKALDG